MKIARPSCAGKPGIKLLPRGWKTLLCTAACLTFAALVATSAPKASAQVSINIGGPPPVCPYGYYDYAPYSCAPVGFYGPGYFYNGIFSALAPGGTGAIATAGAAIASCPPAEVDIARARTTVDRDTPMADLGIARDTGLVHVQAYIAATYTPADVPVVDAPAAEDVPVVGITVTKNPLYCERATSNGVALSAFGHLSQPSSSRNSAPATPRALP
jgi:hypothetical protein